MFIKICLHLSYRHETLKHRTEGQTSNIDNKKKQKIRHETLTTNTGQKVRHETQQTQDRRSDMKHNKHRTEGQT